jgi:CRP-like cAMP-binding protein
MKELEPIAAGLQQFADITPGAFRLSESYWKPKTYQKGEYFNPRHTICRHLAFIHEGVFRSYTVDAKTAEDKNVFLYSKHQLLVPFKSFITQTACDYNTQAMTDATIHYIHFNDLISLYKQSHEWERFGRLLAQEAFNVAMERMESFLFKTPEERYLDLIKRHPDIFNSIPLYHISSYLGIQGPSLSRIRKRIAGK